MTARPDRVDVWWPCPAIPAFDSIPACETNTSEVRQKRFDLHLRQTTHADVGRRCVRCSGNGDVRIVNIGTISRMIDALSDAMRSVKPA